MENESLRVKLNPSMVYTSRVNGEERTSSPKKRYDLLVSWFVIILGVGFDCNASTISTGGASMVFTFVVVTPQLQRTIEQIHTTANKVPILFIYILLKLLPSNVRERFETCKPERTGLVSTNYMIPLYKYKNTLYYKSKKAKKIASFFGFSTQPVRDWFVPNGLFLFC